jgi:hypothetical protein
MPRRLVSWECLKCRREHVSYDDARSCELGHIVDAAVAHTATKIEAAFSRRTRP